MWTLISYEYKKMFHSSLKKLLSVLLIVLPCVYALLLSDYPTQRERAIYASLKGEMNEKWFINLDSYLKQYKEEMSEVEYQRIAKLNDLKRFTVDQIENETISVPKAEEAISANIATEMNQVKFKFDDYTSWNVLYNLFVAFGVLFAIYLVFMLTPVFSQENHYLMMDTIKTSKEGKRQAGVCKIICSVSMAVLMPIIAASIFYVLVMYLFGFTDGDISVSVLHTMTPYSFKEACGYGILIIILGAIAICAMSLLISSFNKNIYFSMSIASVLLLVPLIIYVEINGFNISSMFPLYFMIITNVFEKVLFIEIGDIIINYKYFICMLWIPLSFIFLLFTGLRYRSRE